MPCTTGEVFDDCTNSASSAVGESLCANRNSYADLRRTSCNIEASTTPATKLTALPDASPSSVVVNGESALGTSPASSVTDAQINSRLRTPSSRFSISPAVSFNALNPLPGEEFDSENWVDLVYCRLFLTQYRIIIVNHTHSAACSIPLLSIDNIEARDIVGLYILCKDGKVIRLLAGSSDVAIAWYKKLTQVTCVSRNLDDIFAFKFHAHLLKDKSPFLIRRDGDPNAPKRSTYDSLRREFKHLALRDSHWRISTVNETFDLSATYPQYLIVPSSVTDDDLNSMRSGRFYHRFPTLVWRCKKNGAVLLRSSQPTIGFFGMANEHDVKLYEKIRTSTATTCNNEQAISSGKFLIMDARSYTAAWANRAKGGGFETSDTYSNAEIVFMGLPNIHNIRYSFHQLRQLVNSTNEQNTYLQQLQSTLWLQNIGFLFNAVERCLNSLLEGTSALVHCSDGWDRTTQICSLCMIIGDAFYRTFEGFEILVQRQWIEFGHKFADRSGVLNGDENERSPVFLQFLDCVYQLWMKNPDAFEFNRRYLLKLVQHTYSGLFSSFLFNNVKDAGKANCVRLEKQSRTDGTPKLQVPLNDLTSAPLRALSIWDYLGKHNLAFVNPAYNPRMKHILAIPKLMSEFELWRDAYCCTSAQSCINNPEEAIQYSATSAPTSNAHETSSEKAATLSRSQSASSLTSLERLEQSTNVIQPFHMASPHPNNGTHGLSSSNFTSHVSQDFLDSDGLSKVPIVFEDRVVEMFRQMELQTKKMTESMHHGNLNGRVLPLENGSHGTNGTITHSASVPSTTTRRVRNESVDSTILGGFEMIEEFEQCCKRKHDSSGTSSSCSTISECPAILQCSGCKSQTTRKRIPSMRATAIMTENGNSNGTNGIVDEEAVLLGSSVEDVGNGSVPSGCCTHNNSNGQLVIG
ncbi:myotubularin-like phosphatase domain-containing protein [Ditylenchus destructor]|uniref:Myotubularin-like phosphatase domain-containing protein n=1 Tax=Ditylenchus destructor TaxID=166010 RepID=A0AAD4NJ70_9BILA|nr:myotubularin-like phosphatase domain-containing protein [Ditylenchus destructor]